MPTAAITQATFLGGTVVDFNCTMQFGENGSSQLQVRLVEDKSNVRSTSPQDEGYGNYTYPVDAAGKPDFTGARDTNIPAGYSGGDHIYFPGLGNAVYFSLILVTIAGCRNTASGHNFQIWLTRQEVHDPSIP